MSTPEVTGDAVILIEDNARDRFLKIVAGHWSSLCHRYIKVEYGYVRFRYSDLCDAALEATGGIEDGAAKCPYCCEFFGIEELAFAWKTPLSRGGEQRLENLEFPCKLCARRKGRTLTKREYLELLEFLKARMPLAKQDILNRLYSTKV